MSNLDVVRRIYDEWGRGEFSSSDWAHEDIELIEATGASHRGLEAMTAAWRDFLSSWEEFRTEAEHLMEAGDAVLALNRFGGRGKSSGVPAEMIRAASRFDFRDGKVQRLIQYSDRARALADWYSGSLEGTWSLVEWTASDGSETLHPSGPDAVGRIIYSPDGWMSAFLARADGSTDALAYSGTWERLGEEEVVHHVTISTRASFVGADLVRSVSWEGDDLVLTTPPRDAWVNVLRWRRAAA